MGKRFWTWIGVLLIAVGMAGCGGGDGDEGEGNPFAGDYSGTYTGTESGTWTAVFGSDGAVTVRINSPSVGSFTGHGTITPTGEFNLVTSGTGVGGPYTITWHGTFRTEGGATRGSGTWQSTSGFFGTWTGARS